MSEWRLFLAKLLICTPLVVLAFWLQHRRGVSVWAASLLCVTPLVTMRALAERWPALQLPEPPGSD